MEFFSTGQNADDLPFESPEEFYKLRNNPKFPSNDNDEEHERVKRSRFGQKTNKSPISNRSGRDHKIDDKIRESPDIADNSKFHGNEFLMIDDD